MTTAYRRSRLPRQESLRTETMAYPSKACADDGSLDSARGIVFASVIVAILYGMCALLWWLA